MGGDANLTADENELVNALQKKYDAAKDKLIIDVSGLSRKGCKGLRGGGSDKLIIDVSGLCRKGCKGLRGRGSDKA